MVFNFEKLTYNKKRVAFDYFKSEIQIFHDLVEEIMDSMGIIPEKHEFGSSFSPKSKFLNEYNKGDLMKISVIKNEAILFSVGEKTPDGATAKIKMRKIKNKIIGMKWDIK